MKLHLIDVLKVAAFYQDESGDMFRMQYVNEQENRFLILDEDSGEETWIDFSEVTKDCKFYKLTQIERV